MRNFLFALVLFITPAGAHDWYPISCCSQQDCAEVTNVTYVAADLTSLPLMMVTTEFGTAFVPPTLVRQKSPDNKMHACIRSNKIICLFMPGGS